MLRALQKQQQQKDKHRQQTEAKRLEEEKKRITRREHEIRRARRDQQKYHLLLKQFSAGITLKKHCSKDKPHTRVFYCDPKGQTLWWQKSTHYAKPTKERTVLLRDIQEIKLGACTPVFQRSLQKGYITSDESAHCLSLVMANRNIDLQIADPSLYSLLAEGGFVMLKNGIPPAPPQPFRRATPPPPSTTPPPLPPPAHHRIMGVASDRIIEFSADGGPTPEAARRHVSVAV